MKNKVIIVLALIVVAIFVIPSKVNAATKVSSGTEGDYEYIIYENTDGTQYASLTEYIGTTSEVTVPSTIASVNVTDLHGTFGYETTITSVIIPEGVTNISESTFYGCTNLEKINVDSNNSDYFSIDGILYDRTDEEIWLFCMPAANKSTNVNIPEGVIATYDYAFEGCVNLKSVTIPKSLLYIGFYPFIECTNLEKINVDPSNSCYTVIDDVLYEKIDGKINALICMPSKCTAKSICIPDGVSVIAFGAFWKCSNLVNVTIPNSVEMILYHAFGECNNLKSINIPKNLNEIYYNTFFNCINLTSIAIPKSVTNIGIYAFEGWTENQTINFETDAVGDTWDEGWNSECNATINFGVKFVDTLSIEEKFVFTDKSSKTLTATIAPTDAKYKDVTWKSSDISVATVDSTGKVIAVGNGICKITATTTDGTYITDTCDVTVDFKATSISLNKKSLTFEEKTSQTLSVTLEPYYANNKNVTWTSSNTSIATVDSTGKVTAVGSGTCKITATTVDGTNLSDICNVTVKLFPFTDVSTTKWYYNAINYCYRNNLILGTTSTTFEPSTKLTRGMLVTILYRMEGSPNVTGTNKFTDVKSGKYYYNAVVWAASKGIVNGYDGQAKFGPNDNIKRQDLAGMLSNYARYKGKYSKSSYDLSKFTDSSKISKYALPAMKWAVENKVINGSNGKLNPKGTATRAEAAAMLYNYCLNVK